ncbi:hypothetical protein PR202_gb07747 [Eleusine coracana subsp. coracana]|uniref:PROP1-like PPR domain-containing protein n=1 Tax=Eleusine coracana subsp. coracana TaxID=191504 RepID=A0AAV5ECY9_ELECO|nr:hypothetical protein PR202_gb07747 [Eleusine coracana subsp. coracana]
MGHRLHGWSDADEMRWEEKDAEATGGAAAACHSHTEAGGGKVDPTRRSRYIAIRRRRRQGAGGGTVDLGRGCLRRFVCRGGWVQAEAWLAEACGGGGRLDRLRGSQVVGHAMRGEIHHASFFIMCKKRRAVSEALRFCRLIDSPKISTFNMLLSVCAHSQDFDGALQVMVLLKDAGLTPDCKLYTTLISTCAKCGKVDAMFEVFHEMVSAGIEPNVNTYSALIDGCARAGQVAKAFGAYGIMSSKKVKPDRVIFNALISACGESGAVARAFDVLSEMTAESSESKGTGPILPDHVTVGALMKTCIQAGQAHRAREVYKMLHEYDIKGTPEVYTIALRSCSLTGDFGFALKIYEDMNKMGVKPDEMFLSALVDVAGHARRADAAFEIMKDARAKDLQVGTMAYSSLMGACCNVSNL